MGRGGGRGDDGGGNVVAGGGGAKCNKRGGRTMQSVAVATEDETRMGGIG